MREKVHCRSLISIHILYNQAFVEGLSDSYDPASQIPNVQLHEVVIDKGTRPLWCRRRHGCGRGSEATGERLRQSVCRLQARPLAPRIARGGCAILPRPTPPPAIAHGSASATFFALARRPAARRKWANGAVCGSTKRRARVWRGRRTPAGLLGMGCVLAIATSNTRKYPLGSLNNAV